MGFLSQENSMTASNADRNQHRPGHEKRSQDFLEYSLSLALALAIDAHPHQCFDNAWRMFLRIKPNIFSPNGRFIEGWYVVDLPDRVVMNEHGWCELPNGTILDPTVVRLLPPDCPVYYFPGVARGWKEVKALVEGEHMFPYVRSGQYGADGLRHPDYKAAYDAARHKMSELATATTPPKQQDELRAQDLTDEQMQELEAQNGVSSVHIIVLTPYPRPKADGTDVHEHEQPLKEKEE